MLKTLLDIDGVMVTTPSWKRVDILDDGFSAFSNSAVESLNKLLIATNATVVLTTSHKSNYNIEEWINIFRRRNVYLKLLERLPENTNYLNRKTEIQEWITQSGLKRFIIIDDDKSLNDSLVHIKSKLLLTESLIGLNENKTKETFEMLQKLYNI